MALTDFLSDGAPIPAGSAVKSTTSQTVLPDWYTNYTMNLLANQQAASATPYQPAPMPRVAEFTPAQQKGFEMTGQAATAYAPGLNTATAATQNTLGQSAMGAASPFFAKAGQTSVDNISSYMNPYTQQVVDRIAQQGARNLSENLLPALESKYISAGQLGFGPGGGMGASSGMMTDTARAVRDTQRATLSAQLEALQQGYTQAAGLSAADLERQAQLGSSVAGVAGADITRQQQGAAQLADMAGLAQKYGLAGADAVTATGNQQQAQGQKNLDVAYQDFLAQRGFNQEQINNMLNTLKGVQGAVPTATTENGIVPLNYQQQYAPSTAATIAGSVGAIASTLKDLGVKF